MQLKYKSRSAEKKRDAKRLLREGWIPAVLYVRGKEGETLSVCEQELSAAMRQVPKGRLPTTIFEMVDEKGKSRRAIIKDIQYNVVNYSVIHLDFEELLPDVPVNIKVPIECTGVVDCVGIKLGGVLRQVIRHLRVNCLPKNIPTVFTVDIKDLGIHQYKKLADLTIPVGVRPLADLNEVAVVIAKR